MLHSIWVGFGYITYQLHSSYVAFNMSRVWIYYIPITFLICGIQYEQGLDILHTNYIPHMWHSIWAGFGYITYQLHSWYVAFNMNRVWIYYIPITFLICGIQYEQGLDILHVYQLHSWYVAFNMSRVWIYYMFTNNIPDMWHSIWAGFGYITYQLHSWYVAFNMSRVWIYYIPITFLIRGIQYEQGLDILHTNYIPDLWHSIWAGLGYITYQLHSRVANRFGLGN